MNSDKILEEYKRDVIYATVGLKKNEETYHTCVSACSGADDWNACWEACKVPYGGDEPSTSGILGSGNYNINSPINSDLKLVRNAMGCGAY